VHEPSATAHQAWDRRWNSSDERARWQEPEPLVRAIAPWLRQRGFSRVLDLGCGVGRHALYLAGEGFRCVGIDGSESALSHARQQAADAGLSIDYRLGMFYDLPFDDGSFDAVIAWNVVYHGDPSVVEETIANITRVLVPGGIYCGTMLSKRNAHYGDGREVRPDTFVVDDDAEGDKAHPHLYCDAATVLRLHPGFEVLELRDHEQRSPGAYHWEFIFERR
jgi:SAM-dependent methyltransferase